MGLTVRLIALALRTLMRALRLLALAVSKEIRMTAAAHPWSLRLMLPLMSNFHTTVATSLSIGTQVQMVAALSPLHKLRSRTPPATGLQHLAMQKQKQILVCSAPSHDQAWTTTRALMLVSL